MGSATYPFVWLERISTRLGISYLTGVILLGTLPPFLGFLLGNYGLGAYDSSSPQRIINIASLITGAPVPLVCLSGAHYVSRRVTELGEYSKMLGSGTGLERHLERLASIKFLGTVLAVLAVFIISILATGGGGPLQGGLFPVVLVVLAALYTIFSIATLSGHSATRCTWYIDLGANK